MYVFLTEKSTEMSKVTFNGIFTRIFIYLKSGLTLTAFTEWVFLFVEIINHFSKIRDLLWDYGQKKSISQGDPTRILLAHSRNKSVDGFNNTINMVFLVFKSFVHINIIQPKKVNEDYKLT